MNWVYSAETLEQAARTAGIKSKMSIADVQEGALFVDGRRRRALVLQSPPQNGGHVSRKNSASF
jgi:hypothetical protein